MEPLALLTVAIVLSVAIGIAAARVRDHRHQRIAETAKEEVAVSVTSRLAAHAPDSIPSNTATGGRRDELGDIILALLAAEPNIYTKTALAKQVGSGYATVMKRIAALQDEGRVVPNVRGAKLALAPVDDETSWPSTKRAVASE
jgi:hypothetical protein